MKKILISGGSGLVGKHLYWKLINKGYSVAVLSRTKIKNADVKTYYWDLEKNEIEKEAIETADYIIHLAGANIGEKRWTKKRKKIILESRVKTAQLIFNAVKENKKKLTAYISASAVGYYGAITSENIFTEDDLSYPDFLGETCRKWEEAADNFETLGIRTVKIRTGLVLAKNKGSLSKIAKPVKFGIGSALGNGQQFIPWIHIDDLCNIYIKAIEDNAISGAYNAVATEHITNTAFTKTLAHILNKPFFFPNIPSFVLKLIYGKMAEILLKGSKVSSQKIINTGYQFKFPTLESALLDLF